MPKKCLPSLQKLMELFQTHTIQQLADLYQVKETTIARKIAEAKRLKIYTNPAKQHRNQQISQMLAEGKSFPQIAKILNVKSPDSLRAYATRNGLYSPSTKQHAYTRPIGCRLCAIEPYLRGLCRQCHSRYHNRRAKKLVDYPDQLLILQHPKFTVYYEEKAHRYTIHTQLLDTIHISPPNELEKILLDHLHRQVLIGIDESARKLIQEAAEANPFES
jgi:hypothetical protein